MNIVKLIILFIIMCFAGSAISQTTLTINGKNNCLDAATISNSGTAASANNITSGEYTLSLTGSASWYPGSPSFGGVYITMTNVSIINGVSVGNRDQVQIYLKPGEDQTVTFVGAGNLYSYVMDMGNSDNSGSFTLTLTNSDAPEISLSQNSLNFGNVAAGTSGTNTFTISNTGNATLTVDSISSNNSLFTVSPTSASISAGSNKAITVTFTPTSAGSQSGTITIACDDPDSSSLPVSVVGTGISNTGAISGIITDSHSGSGITGVKVTATPGNYTATTNSAGSYTVSNIPAGTGYTVSASKTGYDSNSKNNITVTAGQSTNTNIVLTAVAPGTNHFTFTTTGTSYSIVINNVKILGEDISTGDEVGVFTSSGICVGATQYDGTLPMGITAWKDDSQTSSVDGYSDGGEIKFRIWDSSSQLELANVTVNYSSGNGKFGTGAYSQISSMDFFRNYQFTSGTGGSYSIVINTIDYNELSAGDEVGVFDGSLCVGSAIYSGSFPLSLTAWKNDPQTNEKDGFTYGNTMIFMYYDTSKNSDLDADAVYSSGDGKFGTEAYAVISKLTPTDSVTQTIALNSGWNLISSYVQPGNLSMDIVFQSVSGKMSIVQNDAGQFYIPGTINLIGNLNISDAYWAYMTEGASFEITGMAIPTTTTIPLSSGWNYVPNYNQGDVSIVTAFSSLGTKLIIAQNDAGQFYIPGTINLINNIQPGKGYTVYLSESATLAYSNKPGNMFAAKPADPMNHYTFRANTGGSYSIVINNITIDGNALESGDEIAAYDGNICVGAVVYAGSYPLGLTVWVDDSQTDDQDGFVTGHSISFKIWDTGESKEFTGEGTYTTGDGTFGNGAYSNISIIQGVSSGPAAQYYSFISGTGTSYSIVINSAVINGSSIETGDEIGIFDVTSSGDSICVGAVVFDGNLPIGLTAWKDDNQTDNQDGYNSGNSIIFKVLDESTMTEYHSTATYTTGDGTFENGAYASISELNASVTTDITDNRVETANDYRLFSNYPNPFNPETTIKYQIQMASFVTLTVYSTGGRKIRTLINETKPEGIYKVQWDGRNENGLHVSSGAYFYRIQAGEFSAIKKMVLLK